MEEIKKKLQEFSEKVAALRKRLKIEERQAEISKLETELTKTGFWDDKQEAQKKVKSLSFLKGQVLGITDLEKELFDLREITESAEGGVLLLDLQKEVARLGEEIEKLELAAYLSGKYDGCSAILSIHAGQGGIEAMDWAQMLQRMYFRFAERRNWRVDVVEIVSGDEAGIKSVTMTVSGPFAYGYLKKEAGAHRLVRQSPFNADRLRQTSFALVEVLPEIAQVDDIPIPESDLEWEFFRASSHGGQNVQKVSTAVRLHHKPTGLVVTSQSERYQERNREIALSLLRAKLWEIAQQEKQKEKKNLKGEFKLAAWGNQIRSYVLHPYKMVKDLRTGFELNNPFAVLDGDLDGFINAGLKLLS